MRFCGVESGPIVGKVLKHLLDKVFDGEIEKFMDFIHPYLDTRGFLGYTRYEEYDDPTLIYNSKDGIIYEKHGDHDCTRYW